MICSEFNDVNIEQRHEWWEEYACGLPQFRWYVVLLSTRKFLENRMKGSIYYHSYQLSGTDLNSGTTMDKNANYWVLHFFLLHLNYRIINLCDGSPFIPLLEGFNIIDLVRWIKLWNIFVHIIYYYIKNISLHTLDLKIENHWVGGILNEPGWANIT